MTTDEAPRSSCASPSVQSADYIPGLDVLRAIAVAAVLYTHFLSEPYWVFGVYWGRWGVRLFFVLSGYLITRMILDDRERNRFHYGRFMIRRFARLYPCLMVFLLLAFVAFPAGDHQSTVWHALYLSNLLFVLQNDWDGMYSHLWSLAVEQQFYLIWPLLILFTPRRFLPVALSVVVLAAPVFRSVWVGAGLEDMGSWVLPPAIFDSLGIGALLSVCIRNQIKPAIIFIASLACASILWVIPVPAAFVASETAQSFLFGALVILATSPGFTPTRHSRILIAPLVYVGQISYGIYMYHLFAQRVWGDYLGSRLGVWGSVADHFLWVILSVLFAAISYHFLEVPVRAWILRASGAQPFAVNERRGVRRFLHSIHANRSGAQF